MEHANRKDHMTPTIVGSPKGKFSLYDLENWAKGFFIFTLPLDYFILQEISAGKSFEEIKPLVIAWVLNAVTGLIKKLMTDTQTVVIPPEPVSTLVPTYNQPLPQSDMGHLPVAPQLGVESDSA